MLQPAVIIHKRGTRHSLMIPSKKSRENTLKIDELKSPKNNSEKGTIIAKSYEKKIITTLNSSIHLDR
jgi:hypothetical protein